MSRGRITFRQRDITAAIKAVERAGHRVARVSIGQDGSIELELASPAANETTPALEHNNEWDEVLDR